MRPNCSRRSSDSTGRRGQRLLAKPRSWDDARAVRAWSARADRPVFGVAPVVRVTLVPGPGGASSAIVRWTKGVVMGTRDANLPALRRICWNCRWIAARHAAPTCLIPVAGRRRTPLPVRHHRARAAGTSRWATSRACEPAHMRPVRPLRALRERLRIRSRHRAEALKAVPSTRARRRGDALMVSAAPRR